MDTTERIPLKAERVRELLHYEPSTGALTWRVNRAQVRIGDAAGGDSGLGYIRVSIEGRRLLAHRLAWLIVYGVWPTGMLDHVNGNGMDNRLANLRIATQTLNNANAKRRKNNTSGLKGVSYSRHARRWRASIQINGKMTNLGYYDTREIAHGVYLAAAAKKFGAFARAA